MDSPKDEKSWITLQKAFNQVGEAIFGKAWDPDCTRLSFANAWREDDEDSPLLEEPPDIEFLASEPGLLEELERDGHSFASPKKVRDYPLDTGR